VPESLILEERPSSSRVRTRDRDFVTPMKFLALGG
jgi:hypothetical protein